jgi:hypothetical protein
MSELCADVRALDLRLAAIVAERSGAGGRGGGGRMRKPHSPAPWNAAAALCRLDLHALARDIEARWRAAAGFGALRRGGSDANTYRALRALERLCDARGVDWRGGARDLRGWERGARMALGDMEQPRRLPSEIACPYCGGKSLRALTGRGIVFCVNANCRTPDGGRPLGRMEYVTATEQIGLTWSA